MALHGALDSTQHHCGGIAEIFTRTQARLFADYPLAIDMFDTPFGINDLPVPRQQACRMVMSL